MYKIKVEDYKNNFNVLDVLIVETLEDVIKILKKLNNNKLEEYREKDTIKYENISYVLNDIYGITIEKIKPIEINDYKAYSQERGDSIYLIFPEDAIKLKLEFNKFIKKTNKKLDYSDNYRIGKMNDEQSMKEYDELYSCCGYYYEEKMINNNKYIFGCNYGH